ncbi:MAG: ATP-binding cassette domain-containing protein [Planctomycetes bacterium]|nr:ATP-binding cassette domain-containing protein [Planctomycetota bacterium]
MALAAAQGEGEPMTRFEIRLELALADFVLSVELATDARMLGVFGASGSGKTSVLEALAGWRKDARGRAVIDGRVLFDERGALAIEARGIGYVPQDLLLVPGRSVRRQILFGPRADASSFERVVAILELGALVERDADTLSGGERQRVALARALCSRPELLLFDEPLGALDLPLRRRILPYLVRARDAFQVPAIFVSHDPLEVAALCDRTAVLERGRVVALGATQRVLRERASDLEMLENVVAATVEALEGSIALARLAGGSVVRVPSSGLAVGQAILFALAAEDVLVTTLEPHAISARNRLPARITAVHRDGGFCWLEAELDARAPTAITVALTPAAIDELELAIDKRVHLVFKTSACRVLG